MVVNIAYEVYGPTRPKTPSFVLAEASDISLSLEHTYTNYKRVDYRTEHMGPSEKLKDGHGMQITTFYFLLVADFSLSQMLPRTSEVVEVFAAAAAPDVRQRQCTSPAPADTARDV